MAAGHVGAVGDELVPAVGAGAALLTDASGEHRQEEERACHGPATQVAGTRRTPGVRCQFAVGRGDDLGHALDLPDRDAALLRGVLEGVLLVVRGQRGLEGLEVAGVGLRMQALHVGGPVDPPAHVVPVNRVGAQEVRRKGEKKCRLGPWPGGYPLVRLRGGVGQARIDGDELRAVVHLCLDDALRVRVEVVA